MRTRVCILARVSTSLQNPDHQVESLRKFCIQRGYQVAHVISTTVTGNKSNDKREDLIELLDEAKKGTFTKVVISEVSRLGRRAKEIRKILDDLHQLGITVVFQQLGVESLDADGKETLISRLIIAIYAEFAQAEREQLSERIKSGLAHARSQGRTPGRKLGSVESPEQIVEKYKPVVKALNQGLSLRQTQAVCSVSRTTVCKVRKALEAA